jgi:hypothetical protein
VTQIASNGCFKSVLHFWFCLLGDAKMTSNQNGSTCPRHPPHPRRKKEQAPPPASSSPRRPPRGGRNPPAATGVPPWRTSTPSPSSHPRRCIGARGGAAGDNKGRSDRGRSHQSTSRVVAEGRSPPCCPQHLHRASSRSQNPRLSRQG